MHENKIELIGCYDNSKGTLYKVATERNWNTYLFDVVKRLERGGKKDPLKQEIEKSINILKLWLSELPNEEASQPNGEEVYHMTKSPAIGVTYYSISSHENILDWTWAGSDIDLLTLDHNNAFSTTKLAEKELERRKAKK